MPDCPAEQWDRCLQSIKNKVQPQSYETWFRDTTALDLGPTKATIRVGNAFFAEWLEEHYTWLISATIKDELGWEPELVFIAAESGDDGVKEYQPTEEHVVETREKAGTPPPEGPKRFRYRFNQFVVGNSNEFTFAAAQAVAENPGATAYNPLVIYGGVGLGKTHLLQAIGDHCLRNRKAKRVVYVSAERFVSDYINAIKRNDVSEFAAIYRCADVLLVDDIQFYVQTEGCQREFLNTFNTLYQDGRQIVISSDRPPSSLKGFEDRLISRFQWGLVTDIAAPELEMRMAILSKKAEDRGIELPDEVARYISEAVTSNVRELEGALTRLIAYSTFKQMRPSVELAQKTLVGMGRTQRKDQSVSIELIQKITAGHFGVPLESLVGPTRKQEVALARHVSMYLCKALTGKPLKAIGNHFGKRDHTTVIHACRNVDQRIDTDPAFSNTVERLKDQIQTNTAA